MNEKQETTFIHNDFNIEIDKKAKIENGDMVWYNPKACYGGRCDGEKGLYTIGGWSDFNGFKLFTFDTGIVIESDSTLMNTWKVIKARPLEA